MPMSKNNSELGRQVLNRRQAARLAELDPATLDRLRRVGKLRAICDNNGRFIAFLKSDILALIGGNYRAKPGRKPNALKKSTKDAA
jgi:hypothetical protein